MLFSSLGVAWICGRYWVTFIFIHTKQHLAKILLSYRTFLGFNGLSNLMCKDIIFKDDCYKVKKKSKKKYQYRAIVIEVLLNGPFRLPYCLYIFLAAELTDDNTRVVSKSKLKIGSKNKIYIVIFLL